VRYGLLAAFLLLIFTSSIQTWAAFGEWRREIDPAALTPAQRAAGLVLAECGFSNRDDLLLCYRNKLSARGTDLALAQSAIQSCEVFGRRALACMQQALNFVIEYPIPDGGEESFQYLIALIRNVCSTWNGKWSNRAECFVRNTDNRAELDDLRTECLEKKGFKAQSACFDKKLATLSGPAVEK
jgi:hypothetical protein